MSEVVGMLLKVCGAEFFKLCSLNMEVVPFLPFVFMFLEDSAEEKKFEPTERKKRRARERGQVARSIEITNILVLGVGFLMILLGFRHVVKAYKGFVESVWSDFSFDAIYFQIPFIARFI